MSDDLAPTGPSQPTLDTVYNTSGNPATQTSAEKSNAAAQDRANKDAAPVEQRIPTKQTSSIEEATPSSLGRGIVGGGPGEEARGLSEEQVGRHNELDGDSQMRAPGEGDVASAVERKPGATGSQNDMAANLDAKKAEQASAREAVKEQRAGGAAQGGVTGQVGGPAAVEGR